jgi:hypothetical protein
MIKTVFSVALLAACAALAGCAGSPAAIGMAKPEQLAAESNEALCNAVARTGGTKARAELERREALTPEEWSLVARNGVEIGMRRLVLFCSRGAPGVYGAINRTVTAHGTREQWVYRSDRYSRAVYVYVDEGVVSAFQN